MLLTEPLALLRGLLSDPAAVCLLFAHQYEVTSFYSAYASQQGDFESPHFWAAGRLTLSLPSSMEVSLWSSTCHRGDSNVGLEVPVSR